MSRAIIDAREWQKVFDLRTGAAKTDTSPLDQMVRAVQERHPYPGDLDIAGNRWVTDTALDLMGRYDPSFVFLTYAQQYFSGRYSLQTDADWAAAVAAVYEEVERFVTLSGFTPLIVGTGGMTPLLASVDLTRLDGLALCTHWSARYAGLHDPSPMDLRTVAVPSRDRKDRHPRGIPQPVQGLPCGCGEDSRVPAGGTAGVHVQDRWRRFPQSQESSGAGIQHPRVRLP